MAKPISHTMRAGLLWNVTLSTGSNFSGTGSGNWHSAVDGTRDEQTQLPGALSGDFNGDGKTDIAAHNQGNWAIGLAGGAYPELVASITSGLGATTTVDYKPLTDPSVYTRDTDAVYPIQDIQAPLYVVSAAAAPDGLGGATTTRYTYAGAKADLNGRGFLGFRWRQEIDEMTGVRIATTLRQDFPFIGQVAQSESMTASGLILASEINTWATHSTAAAVPGTGAAYFPYASRSVSSNNELNGNFISRTTTDNQYDGFGNPTRISVSTVDATSPSLPFVKVSTNLYSNDLTNWYLGRLYRASVTSTLPGGSSATRSSSFSYYPSTGLLQSESIEFQNTAYQLDTTHYYDVFGNTIRVLVSGAGNASSPGIAARASRTEYDAQGRFPVRTYNALNHLETTSFDARFGTPLSVTGPNGLTTR